MKVEVKTDFEFKGKRNYVHSSTITEMLCNLVHTHFHPEREWEKPKVDAQFHKEVTSNGVIMLSEDRGQVTGEESPSAFLRFYDGKRSISAALFQVQNAKVVRHITDPEYGIEGLTPEGEFSGTCHIDCSNRVALVENVIEANKRFHLLTLERKGTRLKVVNLYVKRFPVGLSIMGSGGGGQVLLKIQNQGVRRQGDSVATLNTLQFPNIQEDVFEICFVVYKL